MGCDIDSYAEIRTPTGWEWVKTIDPHHGPDSDPYEVFPDRDYGLFGFLANVRNYSNCPVLARPRGLPADASPEVRAEDDGWGNGNHSHSWYTVAELLAYDYDRVFLDERATKLARVTLREFLGPDYFRRLDMLASLGDPADVRVVFWFDN